MGLLYALAYSHVIVFSLISINSVISQLIVGGTHNVLVASLTLIMTAALVLKDRNLPAQHEKRSPYVMLVAFILSLIVVYAYGFNSVRFYTQSGMSVAVVGTNDDNANHMAMAAISIKDQSMLWSSGLLQKMIDDSTLLPASKWYPFALYTNMNVGYELFNSLLGVKERFDLRSFFSFNTVFTVGLLLDLLILFYALVDRIYKVRSIHSFALILTIGFMVVLGEFLLKLQLYGFHSQLAGYSAFIALILSLDTASKEKRLTFSSLFLICIFIFTVGTAYYLFIPLAGLAYFTFHTDSMRDWRRLIPYLALVLSCIPLLLFNYSHPINEQGASYGVAFIQFTGLMTAALGVLLSLLLKRGVNERLRKMLIFQFGLNIVMMILGTISMFSNTGNFGYYFFKSYWTMGILGLPLLTAFIGYIGDLVNYKYYIPRVIVTLAMIAASGAIFYGVFAQTGYDARGYDNILLIHNGYINYPFDQKKWINIYEKYKDTNGKNIYSIGLWGQSVLARSFFGDTPDFLRKNLNPNMYLEEGQLNILISDHIAQRLNEKKKTVLLDNFRRISSLNQMTNNTERQKLFSSSPYLE